MKITVTLQVDIDFDDDDMIILPPQHPMDCGEIGERLAQGKRCLITSAPRCDYPKVDFPVKDLRENDELFLVDGDSNEIHLGTVIQIVPAHPSLQT